MEYIPTIGFAEAREMAECAARDQLKYFLNDHSGSVLEDNCLEEEYCWLFFKRSEIETPVGSSGDWTYAVSKKGEIDRKSVV